MIAATLEPGCSDPRLNQAVPAACFGELSEAERQAVALHLLECDVCAAEYERLDACIRALRFDPRIPPMQVTPEAISALNLSGRVDLPLSGHMTFVSLVAVLYGALFCASAWTEVGYSYDRYAAIAWTTSILSFVWAGSVAVGALGIVSSKFRQNSTGALVWGACVMLAGIAALLVVLWRLLPAEPTVAATFTTRSAFGGYLKNVLFYFLPVGMAFLVWPFHVIVGLQRELAEGRFKNTLRLLTRDKQAFSPPGVWFVHPIVLGLLMVLAVGIGIQGTQHMLDSLLPGPYANLFTTALYLRVGLWYVVALVGFFWYIRCLSDLKREALAVGRLMGETESTPPPKRATRR